ncbi:MAG: ice-binding family protein [Bacteroidota bacterium]|nr:ice-binding family protein [Bacteroidota bacterium]
MKKLKLFAILAIVSVASITGCKTDDYEAKVGVCPLVVSTIPIDKAIDVPLNQVISATFNEKMDPATINQASFIIQQGTTTVAGTVAYSGVTATFTPTSPLLPNVLYSGTIKTLAKDLLGQSLMEDYKWSFTTIAQVTLVSNPTAGGTTSGAGTFAKGSSVTVNAIPNAGYSFINWTLNGTPVSTTPAYQFTMDGNKALVANFSFQFAVALSSNPAEGGITTGAGSYTAGANVTVTATPNTGYTFVNWTEGLTIASTQANYAFQLNSNRTLVANFKINTYTLTVVALNGTVLKVPLQTTYNHGTVVNLTATPNTGFSFVSWTGDATGLVNATSVTMNSNKTVTANFTAVVVNTYTLNVTAVNGTVLKVPSKTAYNSGEIVVLTATPATGYVFTSWTGDATGLVNPVSVTMNANKNVTANFTAIVPNTYTLNVIANNGTVLKNPNLVFYPSGTNVELTATANPGFTFTGWSGDANGTINPLTVNMNANKNITANFIEDVIIPVGPVVDLKTAGDFSILSKSGISSTGITSVQGDIGVSPAAAAAITGFGLIMNTDGQSSHTTIATHVTGKVYAADYAPPTPSKLTVAVLDMETAYTTANNLVTPAPVLEKGAGNLSGLTLAPGLYKWSTGVLINSNSSVTLSGGANDSWVFQIAQDLTLLTGAKVNLIGGAQAKNITWVVAGQAVLGTQTELYGTILSKTLISLNTGAKVTGKLLAQTAVTLNASTVVAP